MKIKRKLFYNILRQCIRRRCQLINQHKRAFRTRRSLSNVSARFSLRHPLVAVSMGATFIDNACSRIEKLATLPAGLAQWSTTIYERYDTMLLSILPFARNTKLLVSMPIDGHRGANRRLRCTLPTRGCVNAQAPFPWRLSSRDNLQNTTFYFPPIDRSDLNGSRNSVEFFPCFESQSDSTAIDRTTPLPSPIVSLKMILKFRNKYEGKP